MNKCLFIGYTCGEAELRYTNGDKPMAVANVSIGVSEGYGEKQTTSFFDLVLWGQKAESFAKYCPKGTKIGVECRAKQVKWKDKEGKNRYKVVFNVDNWEFAQKKDEAAESKESVDPDGFMNISDAIDEDLPFN